MKSVLLYGAETWRTTVTTMKRIQTFINICLRRILKRYAGQTSSATKICRNERDSSLQKLTSFKDDGSGSATPFRRPHLTSQGKPSPGTLRGKEERPTKKLKEPWPRGRRWWSNSTNKTRKVYCFDASPSSSWWARLYSLREKALVCLNQWDSPPPVYLDNDLRYFINWK